MTNYKQAQSGGKRGGNMKDGHGSDRRPTKAQREADDKLWLDAGFLYQWLRGAPRLTYTWDGNFPVFEVAPGIANDQDGQLRAGMVARNSETDFELCFPYGGHPADIADRLDDEILKIMCLQADVDAPLDWDELEAEGLAYDIDDFMAAGRWARC